MGNILQRRYRQTGSLVIPPAAVNQMPPFVRYPLPESSRNVAQFMVASG